MKKSLKILVTLVLATVLVLSLVGCVDETPTALKAIELSKSAINFTQLGQKETLTIKGDGKAFPSADAVWASSKPDVATVVDGEVVAVAVGSTVISATVGELVEECAVTVKSEFSIVPNKTFIELKSGEAYTADAVVSLPTVNEKDSTWTVTASVIYSTVQGAKIDSLVAVDGKKFTAVAGAKGVVLLSFETTAKVEAAGMPGAPVVANPAKASAVVVINNEATETTLKSIAGFYGRTYDWTGKAAATDTVEGKIKGIVQVELKADGTYTQNARNSKRSTYKDTAGRNLYNGYEQKAENGYIAIATSTMPFVENGSIAILDGKVVLVFAKGATAQVAGTVTDVPTAGIVDFVPFKNLVGIHTDANGTLAKLAAPLVK